jgi:hypothetical protein
MAGQKRPFFVMIGPSNQNGAGSLLSDYPGADLARVIGLPAFPGTTPALVTVPGIKMWQAKLPFAVSDVRNVTDVPATTQIETDGAAFGATNVGQWVYIATNTTGQGNLRRITVQAGNLLTVNTAWSPTLSSNGTVRLITGSRSVGALALISAGIADAGGTTTTMVDAARTEADDFWNGKKIRFTSGANNGLVSDITDFVAATDTTTFSPAVPAAVGAGDTYDIIQSALIAVGTADAGGSTSTLVDAALTEADDFWNGCRIELTSGPDSGQIREITNFDSATDTVSFTPAVTTAIGAGITYNILQSTKVVSQDDTSVAFGAPDVGRWVKFSTGESRKITAVNGRSITLDNALLALPAVNTAIYVLDGAATADTLTNFAQGAAFNDLQFFLDVAPVLFTGFDYANYRQNAPSGPNGTTTSTLVNVVPELMTQLRYRFQDPIYGFTIGVDSAQAASQYIGTSLQIVYHSWMHDVTHLDFHPSNATGIMGAVLTGIASAKALAVAQDDTLDPQGIFLVGMLENDTLDVQKLANLGKNVKLIIDETRTALGNQRVPVVILGCSPSSITLPNHDEDADRVSANAQSLQLKLDDQWTGFVPTPQAAFTKHADGIHYLAPGTVAVAQALVAEWDTVRERANSAARKLSELPTLSVLRRRVKRRYERNDASNDAKAAQIDTAISDSVREIHNRLGDMAWFCRQVETLTATSSHPTPMVMGRVVKRLLRVERVSCPGAQVTWNGISYTDGGRVQISLHDWSGGPFNIHFIAKFADLVADDDITVVPMDHVELIVVMACKRLAESTGNGATAAYYAAESERLWSPMWREAQRYARLRREQLDVVGSYDSWINGGWRGGDEWGL